VRGTLNPGDVISYYDMCAEEGTNLRRGMNYRLRHKTTVILMSTRAGAPYKDRVEENGRVLIYEGHDNPRPLDGRKPKEVNQEERNPDGSFTQNGLFADAAGGYKQGKREPEVVRVYEKIKTGIWVYNGRFLLTDVRRETSEGRSVFKFRLELAEGKKLPSVSQVEIDQTRVIPTAVKLEVWRRDDGKCVKCGASDNLHFDHIIPYSKGGTSMDAKNIQLLCVRHNLEKRDRIE
jgi:HNH endonuclease